MLDSPPRNFPTAVRMGETMAALRMGDVLMKLAMA
jgi:hypothetical protein